MVAMCIRHPASFVRPLGKSVGFNIWRTPIAPFANAMNPDGGLFVNKLSRNGTPQIAQYDEVCMSTLGAEQSSQASAREGPRHTKLSESKQSPSRESSGST